MFLSHLFVADIPERLQHGVLYVAPGHGTAVHLCACGCASEVVTPLGEDGWSAMLDGSAVTLDPSVGNARIACRSHYRIVRGGVVWLDDMPATVAVAVPRLGALAALLRRLGVFRTDPAPFGWMRDADGGTAR